MSDVKTAIDSTNPRELFDQLSQAREKLREERVSLIADKESTQKKLAEAETIQLEAKKTHQRVRKVAARFLRITRSKVASERAQNATFRKQVEAEQRRVDAAKSALQEERAKFVEEAQRYNEQVKDAWERIAEQQVSLAEERQRSEAELSQLFQLLDSREADVAERENKVRIERHELESRSTGLKAELAGLEQRIIHARLSLQELEQQRSKQTVDSSSAAYFASVTDVVPLATHVGRTPEQIAMNLNQRELIVNRELRAVVAAKAELTRLGDELADQRALLVDQFARWVSTHQQWHDDETMTLGELEEIARAVQHREQMLEAREENLSRADMARKHREAELWKFQTKLESWQTALANREASFASARDRIETMLATRRLALAEQEVGLDRFCQTWDERSAGLRDQLMVEISRWVDDRKQCDEAIQECNKFRITQAAALEKLAANAMAIESAKAELDKTNPKLSRRIRVLAKRWTSRFDRFLKEMSIQEKKIHQDLERVERRYLDLRKVLVDATRRQEQADLAERNVEREQIKAFLQEEEPVILSFAEHRDSFDRELAMARHEAERIAQELLGSDENQGVLKLKPAA